MALARAQAARRLFRAQHRDRWRAHAGLLMLSARFAGRAGSAPLLRAGQPAGCPARRAGRGRGAQAHLLAGRIALRLGRADEARPSSDGGRPQPPPRPAPTRARLAGWPRHCWPRPAADPRRLPARVPPRPGPAGRVPAHPGRLGAARPGHRGRRRAGRAGAARRRCAPAGPGAAALERALAGHRPGRAPGPARRRPGTRRRPRRRPRRGQPPGPGAGPGPAGRRTPPAAAAAGGSGPRPGDARPWHPGLRPRLLRTSIPRPAGRAGRDPAGPDRRHRGRVLHVLVCGDGRVRHVAAGQTAQAHPGDRTGPVWPAPAGASGPGRGPTRTARSPLLAATGRQLEQTLLGPPSGLLGDGPVVIVPPGRFHTIPWALLPSLRYRAVSVAPSARAWLRAHAARPPDRRHVVLARGPGLGTEGAEVPDAGSAVRRRHCPRRRRRHQRAVLAALDGAWLGHIAAHGTFRADSPLFSSLRMADGPLTVYDFEQLRRAPYRLILPSLRLRAARPGGADELLGLASSCCRWARPGWSPALRRSTTTPRAADAEPASAPALRPDARRSLCTIRRQVSDDPVFLGAAWSLMALGAG